MNLQTIPEAANDLELLDGLLSALAKHSNGAALSWLYERLDAARTYLIGGKPREYQAQLEFTRPRLPH